MKIVETIASGLRSLGVSVLDGNFLSPIAVRLKTFSDGYPLSPIFGFRRRYNSSTDGWVRFYSADFKSDNSYLSNVVKADLYIYGAGVSTSLSTSLFLHHKQQGQTKYVTANRLSSYAQIGYVLSGIKVEWFVRKRSYDSVFSLLKVNSGFGMDNVNLELSEVSEEPSGITYV